ncbi:MAG: dTMP kinase [Patescibacteria group bacterium]
MSRLIVVDGADGAGKGTQVALLCSRCDARGLKATVFDFPRYGQRTGKLIGDVLAGRHGDFLATSPYLASIPYMLDRAAARDEMRTALADADIVICNRYISSNLAYGAAKIADADERQRYIEFVEAVEHEEIRMPVPTLVLYLSVPVEVSFRLVEQKAARTYIAEGAKDQHEADMSYQARVAACYRELASARKDAWQVVECAPEGALLPPEAIHEKVWELVRLQCDFS